MYCCANSQKVGKINFIINLKTFLIVRGVRRIMLSVQSSSIHFVPYKKKGRRIPIHIQEKVYEEMKKLLKEGHIKGLDKCTSDCFIAPIVKTVKKDDSIKLALDAKPINRQLFKNKYRLPNVDELLDGVSQIVTANTNGTLYFSVLDLKYA